MITINSKVYVALKDYKVTDVGNRTWLIKSGCHCAISDSVPIDPTIHREATQEEIANYKGGEEKTILIDNPNASN